MQPDPTTASSRTWARCQMVVPSPIVARSSTSADASTRAPLSSPVLMASSSPRPRADERVQAARGLQQPAGELVVVHGDPEPVLEGGHELQDGQRVELGQVAEEGGGGVERAHAVLDPEHLAEHL